MILSVGKLGLPLRQSLKVSSKISLSGRTYGLISVDRGCINPATYYVLVEDVVVSFVVSIITSHCL